MRPAAGVAAGHPETTRAAADVLRSGGNAFDAACAAGFASAVSEPALTSLGGGGFLLARAPGEEPVLYDFFVDTPGRGRDARALEPHFFPVTVDFGVSRQDFNVGRGSIAVPGVLAGLLHVHTELGSLPLADVVRPALQLARDGLELSAEQAYFLRILNPIYRIDPTARALYTQGGAPLEVGARVRNPPLADFLESLPDVGTDGFYTGDAAARLEAALGADGLVTCEDLASYRVVERRPLRFEYRGSTLWTNPAPSLGGSLLALSLRLLEERGPLAEWGSADHVHTIVELQREVESLRERGVQSPADYRQFSRGTTHVSVCDAAGNVASMTTSNGEGSGQFTPDSGIHLNNMLGEDDLHPDGFHASPPGERVGSMMAPTLRLRDGHVLDVLGSGGSKRIRTALSQVITQRVDHGRSLREAIEAPRIHWDGEVVQVEPGYAASALDALAARDSLVRWPERNVYFGGVHAVAPGVPGAGETTAAGDPRRGGSIAILRPA